MCAHLPAALLAAALVAASGGAVRAQVQAQVEAPAPDAGRIALGRSIYLGTHESLARPGAARVDGAPVPAGKAACVSCHRPSGLGGAEGYLVVPPVAGFLLFNPRSPQTGRRLPWPSRDRVRPAYDAASLRVALNEGRAPDGVALAAPMPRYQLAAEEVEALAAYLGTLSVDTAPGVTDHEVVFATVTTPDVPAEEVADLVRTLQAFFAEKNGGTRNEAGRRAQAMRNDSTMYRRYRRWRLEHWALQGEPETWHEQLTARYRATPVFALLSGVSYDAWDPVHEFCESLHVPCLLPNAWVAPAREDFYSIYFAPGLRAEVQSLAQALAPLAQVVLWTAPTPVGARQRAVVAAALAAHGIGLADRVPRGDDVLVSTLAPRDLAQRFEALPQAPQRVYAMSGALAGTTGGWEGTHARLHERLVHVSPLAPDAQAARQLARARGWLERRGLAPANEQVAVNALAAAVVAVESLMHVDDRFSREYCIEKIEHNLENIPPLTAYPRLAIGPSQRFASRRVFLRPAVTREGAIAEAGHSPMIEGRP
jgi:hypothetical protein